MYSAIARHIFFPIGEAFLGTRMLKYLKELEETQWWSPAQLQELQNRKLRALVEHAYENVPYYHRLFKDRGLTDKDIQTVEDLQKLPILTKDIIRQNLSDLIARDSNRRRPFLNATSGSTGEPLKFYIDMEVTSISWAVMFRGWEWAGYELGDKRATIAGSSLVPDKSPSLVNRLRWLSERNRPFSAVHMDKEAMVSYARRVLTDSGGIQKEAYILGVPCITLRENTEWVETVEDGWNILVGSDKERIIKMAKEFKPKGEQRNVFGQDVSIKIARAISLDV